MVNNSEKFDEFLKTVCSQVNCSEMHEYIKEELKSHFLDIVEEYTDQGASYEEAERQAMAHIGDAELIGSEFNKVYTKEPHWNTLFITLILGIIGIITQVYMQMYTYDSYSRGIKTMIFNFLGIGLAVVIYFFDYRKLQKYSKHIFVVASLLLLLTELGPNEFLGIIRLPLINVDISLTTLIPVLYLMAFSGMLSSESLSKKSIIKILVCYTTSNILLLSVSSNRIFNFLCFNVIIMALFIIKKVSIKYILSIFTIDLIAITIIINSKEYYLARIFSFLNFRNASEPYNFIIHKIEEIIYTSKLLGNGASSDIFRIIPEIESQWVLIYVLYTFGWIMLIAIIMLFILLIVNLIKVCKKVKDPFGKLLSISVVCYIGCQFIYYLLMNFLLAPPVALALPFIAYGGSSLVLTYALIGLICSIYGRKSLPLSGTTSGVIP